MNSFLAFFQKYKLHINMIFIVLWLLIICDTVISKDFKIAKLIAPLLFIILTSFNINSILKERKK